MSWPKSLHERLDKWGKAAFARELETDFSRARIFDGKWARISFDALLQFSADDLKVLGNILPVADAEFRKSLVGNERRLLDRFEAIFRQLMLSRREQMIEEAGRTAQKALGKEADEIRRIGPPIFKKIAKRLDCQIRKADFSAWMLSRLERWGEIRMSFDLHEEMEFSYDISIEDNDYRKVLERDSYLQRLGISSSACQLTSADRFEAKMERVAEVIEWQLKEYIEIIQPLGWPRIAPFS